MRFNCEKDKLFFTADPHFSHDAIRKYCSRPFKSSEEMNEEIISNWNRVVPDDGIVFLLGDVGFGDASELRSLLNRLNGKIYFIRGNHDNPATHKNCISRFEIFSAHNNSRVEKDWVISIEDKEAPRGVQSIHLYHYPVIDWDKKFHGGWHLHGHSHQTVVPTDIGKLLYQQKIIDVGVDGHNFTPLSYNEVKEIMKTRKTHF